LHHQLQRSILICTSISIFLSSFSPPLRVLHSFPTRRSSDLDFSNPDISDITPVTSFGWPDLSIEAPSTIKKNPLSFCFNLFTALSVISTNFGFLSVAFFCIAISLSAMNVFTIFFFIFYDSFFYLVRLSFTSYHYL